jgi:hypothetical protein
MPEATQTATPTDARQASMSRVQTQDSVLASLTPQKAASEPTEAEKAPEEASKKEVEKPKQTASERIQELAAKRKEAEAKADAERRRADELEARLAAMSANAKPLEAQAKPLRSQFATDDDYIEALSDWKAKEAIAEREKQQAQARAEAEAAETAAAWSKRQEAAMKRLTDYADVIGKSEVNVPEVVHQAILESEQGPEIAYFLALHPAEAKRIAQMKPIAAVKRIAALERDLADLDRDDAPTSTEAKAPDVQKSKAPPPIEPVRSSASSSSSSTNDFESYKRKREAEKRK